MKRLIRIASALGIVFMLFLMGAPTAFAADTSSDPGISIKLDGLQDGTPDTLKILLLLTVISLLPSILIMMTGFTRIVIVLSCVRNAIGLQQTPPNQVLVGLALFLTLFIMSPIVTTISDTAYEPYSKGEITQEQAIDNAMKPLREFMLKQTKKEDLSLFLSLSKDPVPDHLDATDPESFNEIKTSVIIPAFITSELKRAFIIGFLIYLPFLIIDMVVASTLMSMGMVMLPPVMISLPFKIMLFVLVDGWGLIVKTLILSFN